jgi:hypothetical protein
MGYTGSYFFHIGIANGFGWLQAYSIGSGKPICITAFEDPPPGSELNTITSRSLAVLPE